MYVDTVICVGLIDFGFMHIQTHASLYPDVLQHVVNNDSHL